MKKSESVSRQSKKSSLDKRIASYSALAGAFVALSPAAQGAVVYTDVDPDSVITGGGFMNVDIDNNGIPEMQLQDNTRSLNGTLQGIGYNYTAQSGIAFGFYTVGIAGYTSTAPTNGGGTFTLYRPDALNAGSPIGPNLSFNSNPSAVATHFLGNYGFLSLTNGLTFGGFYGGWGNEMDKFLGVRFLIAGNTHYGWVRLTTDYTAVGGPQVIVQDYAYEDVPNTPINAGDGIPPASPATNVMGVDVANNGNGSDLRVDFTKAADESTVSSYRIMVVKSSSAGSFDLAAAESVSFANQTIVAPTGSDIMEVLSAAANDTDGDAITTGVAYKIFVMSAADGSKAVLNSLSAPSPDITLSLPGQADPVSNIIAADIADNGDGSDLQAMFDGAADESTVGEYRLIVVKSANSAGFDLTAAEAVTMANYTVVAKDGSTTYTQVFASGATDADGDALTIGVPYKVYVLVMADGVNANLNVLSQASNEVTLDIAVSGVASNVMASDIDDNSDSRDLQVTFDRVADESEISNYRIMVVKSADAAGFDLAAANGVPSANYTTESTGTGSVTKNFPAGARDVDGASIVIGQPYKVFVMAAPNGTTTSVGTLSAESNEVTLNTPAGLATNVAANDIADNGDGRDLGVTFSIPADESSVSEYRIFVVKSAIAGSFDLATANSLPSTRYTVFDKTGSDFNDVTLPTSARDTDNAKVGPNTPYKVFVLSVADGNNANENALSAESNEVTLSDPIGIEELNLVGVNLYSHANTIFINSEKIEFENTELTIFDVAGKQVLETNITGKQAQIKLDKATDGFYLVNLRLEEGLFSRKVHISNQ